MGKDSPSPPAAPDYNAAAATQGAANKDSAIATAMLSNPSMDNPYGGRAVNYVRHPLTGDLVSSVTDYLNPQSQQIFDAQQGVKLGLAGLGQQGLGTAQGIMGSPFNYNGPSVQTSFNNPSVQSSLDTSNVAKMPINAGTTGYEAMMSRLNPQLDRQRNMEETRLRNQGLVAGGEAYDNARRDLDTSQNDARQQAAAAAIGLDMNANAQGYGQAVQSAQFGNQAAGQQYGQNQGAAQFGNTAAQQSLAQQLGLRNQPLNEITALMSGTQIQNPQFQGYQGSTVAPANYAGATQQQAQYGQGLYNSQVGQQNAQTSGLYGLGAAGLTAMMMS